MSRFGAVNRRGSMKGLHGRHHTNTEPNPVGRPSRKLSFGGAPKPKRRRY